MPFLRALFFGAILGATSLHASPEIHRFEGEAQGTTYHISYSGKAHPSIEKKVSDTLKAFDLIYSNYRPDSSISRYNASSSTEWVPVERELAELVQASLVVSRETAGAFDITIGSVLKVWGFGPYPKPKQKVPADRVIREALRKSGYDKLEVRLDPPALRKKIPDLLIDLSGIAQGASVDVLAKLFTSENIASYLIEVGGEMVTQGEKEAGRPWIVAIEAPTDSTGSVSQTLQTKGLGLSTSGDYRSFFTQNGKRYSHIFDPRIGRPIETHVASASVLAKTVRDADAYAKAFMILKEPEAKALAERLKMPVFIMIHKEKGFRSVYFGDFETYFVRI